MQFLRTGFAKNKTKKKKNPHEFCHRLNWHTPCAHTLTHTHRDDHHNLWSHSMRKQKKRKRKRIEMPIWKSVHNNVDNGKSNSFFHCYLLFVMQTHSLNRQTIVNILKFYRLLASNTNFMYHDLSILLSSFVAITSISLTQYEVSVIRQTDDKKKKKENAWSAQFSSFIVHLLIIVPSNSAQGNQMMIRL